ncbi:transglutaminase-like domain-containing protein [Dysosmobacter sp.]|uniref:transglutaminase-like domain-containing protein n=1 Tax=Dysosmobacter sp. TaxID=2591382 RepID=UPI002A8C0210|nr:transglutaminase-like domain-containing protein [Dysosmobacter sp.]MDY3985983.1 transglutaminase-like domain-containing protein [Dysosmobacter sp.]
MKKPWRRLLPLLLAVSLLPGCGQAAALTAEEETPVYAEETSLGEVDLEEELVALAETPVLPTLLLPETSGTLVKENSKAVIDYSNTKDGYVMVKYTAATNKKLKVQVKGPAITYTYNIAADDAWDTYPLSDGNGSYQVVVYENISGTKYSTVLTASFPVTLTDEFAPFLRPNQYVDYESAPDTVAKAAELTQDKAATLSKVTAIYDYVVKNLTYDKQLAATVQSGYLPVLDTVLAKKSGICFDYAALMTGMLRSQGIPCKLVVGYAGTAYHAWISVWSEETGWVEGFIYFNGTSWQRMDPTFASTGKQSQAIMQYIGDSKNYTTKYLY